jgi:predicted transcriptional regulator
VIRTIRDEGAVSSDACVSQLNNKQIITEEIKRSKRGEIEIMADILNLATEDVRKTRIMYAANLSFEQVERYLQYLVGRGLIEKLVEQDRAAYRNTETGRMFLEHFRNIAYLLDNAQAKSVHESYQSVNPSDIR